MDSLFTMPKQSRILFCNLLIERNIRVKWICYARADDLCEEEVVILLKKSGCIQVQIGIESADLTVLQNMNKKISPEKNKQAISNCRKHGLTTVISLIIGFPGETENSIRTTLEFMKEAPPDFYFLVVFSVRVTEVPILSEKNRSKFGLRVMDTKTSMSPYWVHDTMDCVEATKWVAFMTDEIIKSKISLDAAVFFKEILYYDSSLREELLEFQFRAWTNRNWVRWIFKIVNRFIDYFLKKDCLRYYCSLN